MILPVSQTSLYLPLCTNGAYHSTSFLVSAISKKNWLCSLYLQMLFLDVIVVCKLWISRHVQYDWMQSYSILTPFAVMHLLWVHKNFFASRFCKLIKITHWCFILTRRWLLHPSSSLIWHIEHGAVLWQYVNHILNCCVYVKDNFYKNYYSTAYLLLNNICVHYKILVQHSTGHGLQQGWIFDLNFWSWL